MPGSPGGLLTTLAGLTEPTAVLEAAAGSLRAVVGAGPVFLAAADPVSGLFTTTLSVDISPEASALFFAAELSGRDVIPFATLAHASVPVGSLYAATAGRPQHSVRWREVIEPLGWGDELRAAIRVGSATWGYLCLHRDAHEREYGATDAARLTRLLPVLAAALRRVTLPAGAEGDRLGSGVVLVGTGDRIVGTSGAVAQWLEECPSALPSGLPLPLAAVARHVLRTGRSAETVMVTRTGRHAALEAAPLDGASEPQVAIVVRQATAEHNVARLAAAASLTPREREILSAALTGSSTRAMATALYISEQTVQTHLRSIFGKTGIRSRRELLGRLGP